jgi:hypothetical protein
MFAVLFAMSWAGILIILAGIWLAVVLVRGLLDFVYWLYEVLVVEPREEKRRRELRQQRRNRVPHEVRQM